MDNLVFETRTMGHGMIYRAVFGHSRTLRAPVPVHLNDKENVSHK